MTELGLESFQFRPLFNSLGRGGATFWFAKHGSFDRLLVRGRWQAPRTARIYINSGLAALAEMKVPASKLRGFQPIYKRALEQDLPILSVLVNRVVQGNVERRWQKLLCSEPEDFYVLSLVVLKGDRAGGPIFVTDRCSSPRLFFLSSVAESGRGAPGRPRGLKSLLAWRRISRGSADVI